MKFLVTVESTSTSNMSVNALVITNDFGMGTYFFLIRAYKFVLADVELLRID